MKTLITLIIMFFISVSSIAQQGINYKAILKDTNGNVLADTYMTVQFTVHQGSATGAIVYEESHNYTTDANGLLILNIGTATTPILGVFSNINWGTNQHFLQTTITYSGGTINFDATEFMAVPYAKHAETAETAANVFSGDYNDLINQPTILPTGLERLTENTDPVTGQSIYGWRLIGVNDENINVYDPIGFDAIDLSTRANWFPTINNRFGASGENSIAIGFRIRSKGDFSTGIGSDITASGDYSTALGLYVTASGDYSTAMGNYVSAKSYAETAMGRYNTNYEPNSIDSWNSEDRLFVIGNGNDFSSRSNALTILKNGEVITGGPLTVQNALNDTSSWRLETRPNGSLSMYRNGDYRGFFSESTGNYSSISDRRTKKDITALENGTLKKVMQLNPVSYLMKEQTDTKRNLGLISQEVQKIFPSITNYVEESDLLTLSYTELIPVLIKALQEQQEIINAQNAKDVIQDKSIEALVTRLNLLEAKSTN